MIIILLATSLICVLFTAMLFANAVEHFGEKLQISEGITGSLFIAVGTALPEILVPIMAIFNGAPDDIGIGAILGPPLMLSTLTISFIGFAAFFKYGYNYRVTPNMAGVMRDLKAFLIGYTISILFGITNNIYQSAIVNYFGAVMLLAVYIFYIYKLFKLSNTINNGTEINYLFFNKYMYLPNNLLMIFLQAIVALILLTQSTKLLLFSIDTFSQTVHISNFILSLILIPIATELPEKINSILWIRQKKDTLAFANVTGAMVFQSILLPAILMIHGTWKLGANELISIFITYLAVFWLIFLQKNQYYKAKHLICSGVLYILNLLLLFIAT